MDFVIVYFRLEVCGKWAPAFKIVNTGNTALSSYSIIVEDKVNKTSLTKASDDFNQRQGCAVVSDNPTLVYGKVGYIYSRYISKNPTGDEMKATITVCTRDGQGGKCKKQVLNFTP
jgi:hypothetical protein